MATNNSKTMDIDKSAAADGLALTEAERAKARKEGAIEDVKEAAQDTHRFLTDGQNLGEAPKQRWLGHDDIMQWAYYLEHPVDAFTDEITAKGDAAIPEGKVYGLLALERNGQNRTPYVKAMMKRLGITKDELPGGGPAHTNDVTPTTAL